MSEEPGIPILGPQDSVNRGDRVNGENRGVTEAGRPRRGLAATPGLRFNDERPLGKERRV